MATKQRLLVELCVPAITPWAKGSQGLPGVGGFYAEAEPTLVCRTLLCARHCLALRHEQQCEIRGYACLVHYWASGRQVHAGYSIKCSFSERRKKQK